MKKEDLIQKIKDQLYDISVTENKATKLILKELKKDISKIKSTLNKEKLRTNRNKIHNATQVLTDLENAKGNNLDFIALNSFHKNFLYESFGNFTKSLQNIRNEIDNQLEQKKTETQNSDIEIPEASLNIDYHMELLNYELSNQINNLNSQDDINIFLNDYAQEMFKYDLENKVQHGTNRDGLTVRYTEKEKEKNKDGINLLLNQKGINGLHRIRGSEESNVQKMSLEENGVHIHIEHGSRNKTKPPLLNLTDNSNGTGTIVLSHCYTNESQVHKALKGVMQAYQTEYPNLLFFNEEISMKLRVPLENRKEATYIYANGLESGKDNPSGTKYTSSKNKEQEFGGANIAISPSKQVLYIGPEPEKAFNEDRIPKILKHLDLNVPANFAKMERPLINARVSKFRPEENPKFNPKKKSTNNANISFKQKFAQAFTSPSISAIENKKPFIIPTKQPIEKKLPKRKQYKPS